MRVEMHHSKILSVVGAALLALVAADGCGRDDEESRPSRREGQAHRLGEAESAGEAIPRFVVNSPFVRDYNLPAEAGEKRLWAQSFLWEKAPGFVVEQWLTPEPRMEGKYLLIEYWATWCAPCRRSIAILNEIHRRFRDRLVVVGISDESKDTVLAFKTPKIEYHLAIDTQARMKKALGVVGIPHAIVVEPEGYVVWEGYPLLAGYELTVDVVERILNAGRTDSGRGRENRL